MKIYKATAALVAAAFLSAGSISAQAGTTLYTTPALMADFSGEAGSVNTTFASALAGSGFLSFQLEGLNTLDGYGNGYTDLFTLSVNGVKVFEGSFNMGGGGNNATLFDTNGATVLTTTNGANDDPHHSTQITWAGGVTDIAMPIALQAGVNTVTFAYGPSIQGIGDEGWRVNGVTIAAVPEPEIYATMLGGLAMIGAIARRKRR